LDPVRYKKIMQGEEGVPTVDGSTCIYEGKKSAIHAATVVGDTAGDPFKDTSGPAFNIVMKLMAILSVEALNLFPRSPCVWKSLGILRHFHHLLVSPWHTMIDSATGPPNCDRMQK